MKEYIITYINEYGVEIEHMVYSVGIYGALNYFFSVCAELEIEVEVIKIEKRR